MKKIVVRKEGKFTTAEVIKSAAGSSTSGMTITQMRSRLKVLEAMDKAGEYLELEDADYNVLSETIENTPWTLADKELLQVLDDILEAK